MADRVRVSSKGQIVIPKKIRDELGIKQGDYLILEYDESKNEIILRIIKIF
ncbi:AbrB/MazE/SpoVT family DNA-binding domain-containing protein [Thermodesulfatator indicus]